MKEDFPDVVQRFGFVAAPIRGQVATLGAAWRAIRERHPYPEPVAHLLGEMVVTVALLAQNSKSDGSIILQTRGDGVVQSAMTECRERRLLRGLARLRAGAHTVPATRTGSALGLLGAGQLAITLSPPQGPMYQGLIAIAEPTLARCVESYFTTSEQLPTRLWIAASAERTAGVLLQRLPPETDASGYQRDGFDEDWRRIQALTDAMNPYEFLELAPLELLRRLYPRETLRVPPGTPLEFACGCSRERSSNALRLMGRSEVLQLLEEEAEVRVTCEFCGITYRYDAIDTRVLFEPAADGGEPISH